MNEEEIPDLEDLLLIILYPLECSVYNNISSSCLTDIIKEWLLKLLCLLLR